MEKVKKYSNFDFINKFIEENLGSQKDWDWRQAHSLNHYYEVISEACELLKNHPESYDNIKYTLALYIHLYLKFGGKREIEGMLRESLYFKK